MARKLASIQKIATVEPIEGADRIEKITMEGLGWVVVTKKDEFKVGDPCVYFEYDSVLPDGAEWAEFMRPRKFRVKTAKLRGVLSQGLALPVSILGDRVCWVWKNDVTEHLGVKKYEPPADKGGGVLGGQTACGYPGVYLPKTDETRIQSCLGVLNELRELPFYATVKVDGTSGTFLRLHEAYGPFQQGELMVCTRNRALKPPAEGVEPTVYHAVAARYKLAERIPEGFAVQGEVAGPGIQKNRLMLTKHDLFVFNVWDLRARRRLNWNELWDFVIQHDLNMVPTVGMRHKGDDPLFRFAVASDNTRREDLEINFDDLNWWLELAKGKYEGTKNRREGIVIRPLEETYSPTLDGLLSIKVINNDFLLKDED